VRRLMFAVAAAALLTPAAVPAQPYHSNAIQEFSSAAKTKKAAKVKAKKKEEYMRAVPSK
jgi:hypothetical protein